MRRGSWKSKLILTVVGLMLGVIIGLLLAKVALTYRTKADIMNVLQSGGVHTITINHPLVSNRVVEQAVREHNKTAEDGDVYSVYKMEANTFWVSSANGYQQEMETFNYEAENCFYQIEEGIIWQATISFTYATEEQKNHYQLLMAIWESYAEAKVSIQRIEEQKGDVTIVIVILTTENFVADKVVPVALLFYNSCNLTKYLLKYQ